MTLARVTEESLIGQIRALSPGQSFSRSSRIDMTAKSQPTVNEALQKLRNLVNQAVGRLRKEQPGSNFRVESASGLTSDNKAILCTVAVTNMADRAPGQVDDEDDEEVDI